MLTIEEMLSYCPYSAQRDVALDQLADLRARAARVPRIPPPAGAVALGQHGDADLFYRIHNGVPEVDWRDEQNCANWHPVNRDCCVTSECRGHRAEAWRRARELGLPTEPQPDAEALKQKLAEAERFIYALDPCMKCWGHDTDGPCTCSTAARLVNAEAEVKRLREQPGEIAQIVELLAEARAANNGLVAVVGRAHAWVIKALQFDSENDLLKGRGTPATLLSDLAVLLPKAEKQETVAEIPDELGHKYCNERTPDYLEQVAARLRKAAEAAGGQT